MDIMEIEDSNPLTEAKLADYAWLWFVFDSHDRVTLRLFVVDRYGLNPRSLPLANFYFALTASGVFGGAAA
jgi:hypothetical protein